jgi:hypothetical protein
VIVEHPELPVYLKVAEKAMHLRELGMSGKAIARVLGVSDKTVAKAIPVAASGSSSRRAPCSASGGARCDGRPSAESPADVPRARAAG